MTIDWQRYNNPIIRYNCKKCGNEDTWDPTDELCADCYFGETPKNKTEKNEVVLS